MDAGQKAILLGFMPDKKKPDGPRTKSSKPGIFSRLKAQRTIGDIIPFHATSSVFEPARKRLIFPGVERFRLA
ncbi:hypothetical protein JZU69_00110 [bacterium]|nr:hypothetical protein [bacterium]